MLEIDLYPAVKTYLEAKGYWVQAEVKHCDIAAVKDDELIIVELKTSANMRLLVQATARQSMTDVVYIAIPEPKTKRNYWRGVKRVIKQLGLGLLVVTNSELGSGVINYFDPKSVRRKCHKKRQAVVHEIKHRSASYNQGGSVGVGLVTAYKENAILIACYLKRCKDLSTQKLRQLGTGKKTTRILYNNHYGWFKRIARGQYVLTPRGHTELAAYPSIVKRAEQVITQHLPTT